MAKQDLLSDQFNPIYRMTFESMNQGFCLLEKVPTPVNTPPDFRYLLTNSAFTKHSGLQQVVGKTLQQVVPRVEEHILAYYDKVALGELPVHFETYVSTLDRWIDTNAFRIGEHNPPRIAVLFADITERKKAEVMLHQNEQRQAFLLQLSDTLRPLADPVAIQATVTQTTMEYFGADRSYYCEIDGDTIIVRRDAYRSDLVSVAASYSLSNLPLFKALFKAGRSLVVTDIYTTDLLDEEIKQFCSQMHILAFINVPVIKQSQLVGNFCITQCTARNWTTQEVDLAQEIAERTWSAVEQARAEGALRKSEAQLEADLASMQRLYDLHAKLATETSLQVALDEILTTATEFTGTDRGYIQLVSNDGERLDLFAWRGYTEDSPFIRYFRNEGLKENFVVARPGRQRLLVEDWDAIPTSDDSGFRSVLGSENLRASQSTPMISRRGETIGVLSTQFKQPYRPTDEELRLLDLLAWAAANFIERYRAEVALRESEKRLRLAIEATNLSTWEWDLTTNQVYWNEQHFLLLGLEPRPNPIDANEFFHHVHPGERERLTNLLTTAIAERSVYDAEFLAVRGDGSQRYMSGYGRVVEEVDGKPTRMSGVMLDVTERRLAREALYQSEARQRAILESAKDYAIFTTDLNRRVNSWNWGAQALFGYSEADIMNQSADQLFTIEDRQQCAPQQEVQTAISQGKVANERWHNRQDGSRFYGSGVITPLHDGAGSVIGLLKVMRNLTDQKQAEEALKEADRRKDEFLAMLAHELRNPMATIRNGLTILSLTNEAGSMASQTVTMMNRQVDHLIRMVDDLLDVSRISRSKIKLQLERVELGILVAETVEAIRPQYEARQKQLHLADIPAGLFFRGDATRLSQVITNLLTNGLRYTGDQGQIWVSLAAKNGEAVLRLADNGIGLSADQLVTIFDLFVQVNNSFARTQGGLGVGLTLAKRLVEMHKGRLEAHSAGLGLGSEFVVYLPLLNESAKETTNLNTTFSAKAVSQRILLIDDNPDAALTLSILLKMKGYDVYSRHSGREGIQAAEALQPTLILCDIGMPELDGFQTCRLIRQQAWGKTVMIIALTGYGQQEDKQRTKEAGFDEHLVKPVDLAVLDQLLADLPTQH